MYHDFGIEIKAACDQILAIEPNNTMVHSIRGQGIRKTVISGKQASALGTHYKRVVNKGKYVHHDWWPNK